ncbi:hypothetical protein PCE1_003678 [Barthelona sp. PCE]
MDNAKKTMFNGFRIENYRLQRDEYQGIYATTCKGRIKKSLKFVSMKKYPLRYENRFNRERAAAKELSRDLECVESVISFHQTQNHRWISRPFISGVTLQQIFDKKRLYEFFYYQELRKIITTMRDALFDVHRHGFIHGDLKGTNIVFQNSLVFFVDLGGSIDLKVFLRDEISYERFLKYVKTVYLESFDFSCYADYCAPEILLEGGVPSFSSDIYMLGILFYQLVYGKKAYEQDFYFYDEAHKINQLLTGIEIDFVDETIPAELRDLIKAMTEREVVKRYSWKDLCDCEIFLSELSVDSIPTEYNTYFNTSTRIPTPPIEEPEIESEVEPEEPEEIDKESISVDTESISDISDAAEVMDSNIDAYVIPLNLSKLEENRSPSPIVTDRSTHRKGGLNTPRNAKAVTYDDIISTNYSTEMGVNVLQMHYDPEYSGMVAHPIGVFHRKKVSKPANMPSIEQLASPDFNQRKRMTVLGSVKRHLQYPDKRAALFSYLREACFSHTVAETLLTSSLSMALIAFLPLHISERPSSRHGHGQIAIQPSNRTAVLEILCLAIQNTTSVSAKLQDELLTERLLSFVGENEAQYSRQQKSLAITALGELCFYVACASLKNSETLVYWPFHAMLDRLMMSLHRSNTEVQLLALKTINNILTLQLDVEAVCMETAKQQAVELEGKSIVSRFCNNDFIQLILREYQSAVRLDFSVLMLSVLYRVILHVPFFCDTIVDALSIFEAPLPDNKDPRMLHIVNIAHLALTLEYESVCERVLHQPSEHTFIDKLLTCTSHSDPRIRVVSIQALSIIASSHTAYVFTLCFRNTRVLSRLEEANMNLTTPLLYKMTSSVVGLLVAHTLECMDLEVLKAFAQSNDMVLSSRLRYDLRAFAILCEVFNTLSPSAICKASLPMLVRYASVILLGNNGMLIRLFDNIQFGLSALVNFPIDVIVENIQFFAVDLTNILWAVVVQFRNADPNEEVFTSLRYSCLSYFCMVFDLLVTEVIPLSKEYEPIKTGSENFFTDVVLPKLHLFVDEDVSIIQFLLKYINRITTFSTTVLETFVASEEFHVFFAFLLTQLNIKSRTNTIHAVELFFRLSSAIIPEDLYTLISDLDLSPLLSVLKFVTTSIIHRKGKVHRTRAYLLPICGALVNILKVTLVDYSEMDALVLGLENVKEYVETQEVNLIDEFLSLVFE